MMLSIVLPLATHVWRRESEEEAWGLYQQRRLQRQRQRHRHNSGLETTTTSPAGVAAVEECNDFPGDAVISSLNHSNDTTGDCGAATAVTPRRQRDSRRGRDPRRSGSRGEAGSSGGSRPSGTSGSPPSPTTSSLQDDGFEMVEAPPLPTVDHMNTAKHGTARNTRGIREFEGEACASPRADETCGGVEGRERDGAGGRGGGAGGGGRRSGAAGVQLSSPGLLALLLMSKSFLKHLSSLRRAANFGELWRQVRLWRRGSNGGATKLLCLLLRWWLRLCQAHVFSHIR